ncbi:MAG: hypothetical protein ACREFR_01920 [Limisphaerales bacterium]
MQVKKSTERSPGGIPNQLEPYTSHPSAADLLFPPLHLRNLLRQDFACLRYCQ